MVNHRAVQSLNQRERLDLPMTICVTLCDARSRSRHRDLPVGWEW